MKRLSFALLPVALLCVAAHGKCGDSDPPVSPILLEDGSADTDAGCASGSVVCNEPNIPVGCFVGAPTCVNGIPECGPVICPDAGADDASQDSALPDAASPDSGSLDGGPLDASPPDAAIDSGAATDAGAVDAGIFTCDSGDGAPITCDGRTQACLIVEGGVYPGIHAPSCVTLPPACQATPTCACAMQAELGMLCADQGGNITVTDEAP
jgi:hypothetical protein